MEMIQYAIDFFVSPYISNWCNLKICFESYDPESHMYSTYQLEKIYREMCPFASLSAVPGRFGVCFVVFSPSVTNKMRS